MQYRIILNCWFPVGIDINGAFCSTFQDFVSSTTKKFHRQFLYFLYYYYVVQNYNMIIIKCFWNIKFCWPVSY